MYEDEEIWVNPEEDPKGYGWLVFVYAVVQTGLILWNIAGFVGRMG